MGNKQSSKRKGKTENSGAKNQVNEQRDGSNNLGERDVVNTRSTGGPPHPPTGGPPLPAPDILPRLVSHAPVATQTPTPKTIQTHAPATIQTHAAKTTQTHATAQRNEPTVTQLVNTLTAFSQGRIIPPKIDYSSDDDDDEEYEGPCAIIDNGSAMIKAGLAGDDKPRAIIPSIVGRVRNPSKARTAPRDGFAPKDTYCGDEANGKRAILNVAHPIEHGVVQSWDSMETLWKHTFYNELRISPEEHPVLLTDAPLTPKANREKTSQMMFEALSVPAMYVTTDAKLPLYFLGRNTGLVVTSGYGSSYTVPISEGSVIEKGVQQMRIAGQALTEYMKKLLQDDGYSLTTNAEHELVVDIKQKLSYVSQDFDKEMSEFAEQSKSKKVYELPDGRIIKVDSPRFRCPEVLFNPSLIGSNDPGLARMLCNTVRKTDNYGVRNIVLSGGSTLFPGMTSRLTQQIRDEWPCSIMDCSKVLQPIRFSVFLGGSILACLDTFKSMCITSEDYDDVGPSIVHRKCL